MHTIKLLKTKETKSRKAIRGKKKKSKGTTVRLKTNISTVKEN